jgi:hypothetical protein
MVQILRNRIRTEQELILETASVEASVKVSLMKILAAGDNNVTGSRYKMWSRSNIFGILVVSILSLQLRAD